MGGHNQPTDKATPLKTLILLRTIVTPTVASCMRSSAVYTNSGLIGLIGHKRPLRGHGKPQPNYMRKFELDGKTRHFQSVTTDY